MIEWLQNFSGLKSMGPNMERIELENLRKEMAKYKKKYADQEEDVAIPTDSEVYYSIDLTNRMKMMKNKTK